MKAFVLHAPGDARIEERPEPPAPGAGEVRLTVTRVGLCGTDASEYAAGPVMTPLKTRHPASGAFGPVVLGHEFIGVVETAGTGSERFAPGDRVAAGAGVWCGECAWCQRGQTNLCRSYWTYGLSADGGLTQRITVPERMLHPVAAHVSDDNAALAQPLAVGLHAVDRSRVRPGDVVVVHGAGAIGSFVLAGLRAAGAGTIVAVDIDAGRLDTATKLGADVTVNAMDQDPLEVVKELTGGDLADVAVEASGVADGLTRVHRMTRRGGTVLLVGLPKGAVSFQAAEVILREIDVMTTLAHVCDQNLPAALTLLAERDLASVLVDRVVPLDRVLDDALQPMVDGLARGKMLVDPQVGAE